MGEVADAEGWGHSTSTEAFPGVRRRRRERPRPPPLPDRLDPAPCRPGIRLTVSGRGRSRLHRRHFRCLGRRHSRCLGRRRFQPSNHEASRHVEALHAFEQHSRCDPERAKNVWKPARRSLASVVDCDRWVDQIAAQRAQCSSIPTSGAIATSPCAQFGKGEPAAPASPSRGPGNGILRAETGGLFQAQNAGEQSEFGSQTTLRLTNPPELRGFLSTRKPPRFVGTAWWGMQELN